jgi:hypothetical protein
MADWILPVICSKCTFEAKLEMVSQGPAILQTDSYTQEYYLGLCVAANAEQGISRPMECKHFTVEISKVVRAFRLEHG